MAGFLLSGGVGLLVVQGVAHGPEGCEPRPDVEIVSAPGHVVPSRILTWQ